MSVPHPIPYQGSKRHLAQSIIAYFPSDLERLIEPFAGSAAVSLAAAYYQKGKAFLLNDINEPLMTLWAAIAERPEAIAEAYKELWHAQEGREREFYDLVRSQFNQTRRPEHLLYLLARCVKAAVRYNSHGEFNQSPDNRRKGTRPSTMREHLLAASMLFKGKVSLHTGDYHSVLKSTAIADLVYMDPPYQGVCGTRNPRYVSNFNYEDFVESLKILNYRRISYVISYDGRTGSKKFGQPLPSFLNLKHIEINAGRSSQATLLGRDVQTYESLYLSPALVARMGTMKRLQDNHTSLEVSL